MHPSITPAAEFGSQSDFKNKVTAKLFSMDLEDFFCSIKANIKLVDASVISALLKVPALFEIREKN